MLCIGMRHRGIYTYTVKRQENKQGQLLYVRSEDEHGWESGK